MKKAYLTIDDAPSDDFLNKVQYLKNKNIPAIFFCIGKNIENHFNEVVSAIEDGFIIGNHSYSHSFFSDLEVNDCFSEIQKTDKLINELYEKAKINRNHRYFRFPYFDAGGHSSGLNSQNKWSLPKEEWNNYPLQNKKENIQKFLSKLNYVQPNFEGINTKYFADENILKDLDTRCTFDQAEYHLGSENAPWGLSNAEAILARVDEDFPYEGRSLNCTDTSDIILIHDHEYTTELFYKIIDRYIEKDISFQPFY